MRFTIASLATVLVGAVAVLAAPTPRYTGCKLSGISIPSEAFVDPNNSSNTLPGVAQNEQLAKIVLGYGSQNYSCTNGVPTPHGAVATLYDLSCAFMVSPEWADVLTRGAVQMDPTAQLAGIQMLKNMFNAQFIAGVHYFKGDFATPAFEFVDKTKFIGGVGGKIPALLGSDVGKRPLNFGAVPSLKLVAKQGMGSTFSSIYRLHTAGGVAPKTCDWAGEKQIPYAAQYWVYKSK
ncbi:hypothetical protein TWF173_005154 [Orbilia oligospora]|uniref:Malate dehydrogenase n=2 Tax=Orbilia oligospora TaxID=2813651 RepID=G1XQU2_ARTOA|nr:hypothetical protein AOL_s00188g304 [Orbilia oligospora ATCC 24927]EGX44636.1 hypothetical protein AOL_s00188g304 [Orbilia oligospora ATCC 24927]KAF3280448.1 hypothetical protein TWF970_002668 [Orbilia oligospora]KAF3314048.1 hypothetical protein TWF173_005154 [Orbilia oligospora]